MQWMSDITGVIDIIESYIETDLSAQDIARSMEISYTTLQQLFRSFTGYTVADCTISEIVQTKQFIYKEWLPFSGYKSAYNYNMEWNSRIGEPGLCQKCEIWVPVMIKAENNYGE